MRKNKYLLALICLIVFVAIIGLVVISGCSDIDQSVALTSPRFTISDYQLTAYGTVIILHDNLTERDYLVYKDHDGMGVCPLLPAEDSADPLDQ